MQIISTTRIIVFLGLFSVGLDYARTDELQDATSLRFVPETASFYTTSLRLKEQWDRFAASKAYARLRALPMVKMAVDQATTEWQESDDEPVVKLREFLGASENQNLIKLACDAVSHEIFMFGDENLGRALGKLNQVNRQVSSIQWKALGDDESKKTEMQQEILDELVDSLDEIELPQFVFGFRSTMPALARSELTRLKEHLQHAAEHEEELRGRVTQVDTDKAKLVVVRFDGSQIPWDKAIEDEPDLSEQISRMREKLEGRQLMFALGVVDDYIVFIVTPESDVTKCLRSDDLLFDSEEFERLREYTDRKIVSVGYVSDEFAKEISNPKEDIQQIVQMVDAVIPMMEIDEDIETELRADIQRLIGDLQALIPTPGAMLSFSFSTDSGYEGYIENWSQNLYLDASETLDILEHVGGNPIAVVARNSKPLNGKLARDWFDRIAHYVEKIVLENELEEEQWDLYAQVRDTLVPIVKEHREVTDKHWNKAFSSGQSAFVVDAALEAKPMWHFLMPPSRQPLPMIEFAWVYPLANRFELEQALERYQEVGEKMLNAVKKLVQEHQDKFQDVLPGPAQMLPALIQNAQAPKPLEREVEDGKILYRATLQQAGIDSAIAPNLGWNSSTFAYSLSPATTERVLQKTDISGPLEKAQGKKLAQATFVDVSRLIGFFRPWAAYGMELAKKQGPSDQIEDLAPQIDTILEVMQCYHRYYSITLEADESLVTHFRSDFADLN